MLVQTMAFAMAVLGDVLEVTILYAFLEPIMGVRSAATWSAGTWSAGTWSADSVRINRPLAANSSPVETRPSDATVGNAGIHRSARARIALFGQISS